MEKNEILVLYGADYAHMAERICAESGLVGLIGDRKKRIGIKPNLLMASPAPQGATTHPELCEGVIRYLQENGFLDITILEGAWVGARTGEAFSACGYERLARAKKVRLLDTQKDSARTYDCKGMDIAICDGAMSLDFIINMPVMKGHCQTKVTCALKNNKGVIPNSEKRRFHTLGLHRPIAHLNTVARNDFILVDGICGDLDFEEGGSPMTANRIFAALDPVLCDAYAAAQIGYRVEEVPYIGMAAALGVGCCDLSKAKIRELNQGLAAGSDARSTRRTGSLDKKAAPLDACSACYSSLLRAFSRLSAKELEAITWPVAIGQGWRGKTAPWGVGSCAKGCKRFLPGCPPSTVDILEFLRMGLNEQNNE